MVVVVLLTLVNSNIRHEYADTVINAAISILRVSLCISASQIVQFSILLERIDRNRLIPI
jgi:hypothetical protein